MEEWGVICAMSEQKGLDYIYDLIDDMLHEGQFQEIDDILEDAAIHDLPVLIVLALLTTTLAAKTKLKNRSLLLPANSQDIALYRGLE